MKEDIILYPRLTDISQLIPATDTTTKAEAPTHTEPPKEKKRKKDKDPSTTEDPDKSKNEDDKPPKKTKSKDRSKKPRWTDEQREAAKKEKEENKPNKGSSSSQPKAAPPPLTPTEADALLAEKKKAKQIKKKVRKLNPEERISGPGNIEEARKIRETLGYINKGEEREEGAITNAAIKPGGAFSFGFQPKEDEEAAAAGVGEKEKEEKRATVQRKHEQTKSETPSSSDNGSGSSSSSSSSSDEEEEEATAKTTSTTNNNDDDDDGLYVSRRVYVGGMPYTCTEDQIQEYWSYCGEIESMDALTFPDTGRFRGLVYITFTTEEGYKAALACDGEECEGKKVKVQKCKKPTSANNNNRRTANAGTIPASTIYGEQGNNGAAAAAGGGGGQYQSPARKVAGYNVAYVGNVAYEVDDNALMALFAPYGVTLVRLHTDKDTGKPKGYAHVHFKDEASLDAAVGLDGVELMGRRLRVGYAQAKRE